MSGIPIPACQTIATSCSRVLSLIYLAFWAALMLPNKVIFPKEVVLDITKDIQPMTTFRNHSAEFMQHIKATKRPVILTVNGRAAAVLQDAEAYQHLLDLAAEANAGEGIRQGLEDAASGRTYASTEIFAELRAEYGIPR